MDTRNIVQQSLDYIEDNLQGDITAQELAKQAGFSPFHFYRLFQSVTGMTVAQYILHRRLLHGIYSISQGQAKIEAAMAYGFDTYAGFYKAFCREFNCFPSEYLRSGRVTPPYRIDLNKEEHGFVTHKKARQILKLWNLEQEPISDIYCDTNGRKRENACYAGENYVLKYTGNLHKLKTHRDLSQAVENVGLLAPTPIPTMDGRDYVQEGDVYYYVTKRLPCRQMNSVDFYDKEYVSKARFVGEMLGHLHQVLADVPDSGTESNLLEQVRNWALPEAKKALDLSEQFCTGFINKFSTLYPNLPRQIIHRDPNPGNILCGDTAWGFIDFDLAERNVRLFDPCYAATAILSETFGRNNEKWLEVYRNILYGYDSIVHLTSQEHQAAPYVLLANQFVCVAWFSTYEKHSALYNQNVQMTRWLVERLEDLKW